MPCKGEKATPTGRRPTSQQLDRPTAKMSPVARNPPWDEHERLLALDLYLRHRPTSRNDPRVILLSELLNRRGQTLGIALNDDFRNSSGVGLKMANFAALDPSYRGAGMSRFSRGDRETWDTFSGDTDLLSVKVEEILAGLPTHDNGVDHRHLLLEVESAETIEYEVSIAAAVRLARRSEAGLVQDFADYLRQHGNTVGTHHHSVPSGAIRVDLVDETRCRLWEAKSEVGRSAVRMAIGQLADYRRFEPTSWSTGVLLSRRPSDDLIALCLSVDAAVAWATTDPTRPFVVREPGD
jgi:hypothetical protein